MISPSSRAGSVSRTWPPRSSPMRPSTAALPDSGHDPRGDAMSTQPPSWAGAYVGIPYLDHGAARSGCDCWGLVRLIYRERTRIELPSYAGDYAGEADSEGVGRCVEAA